MKIFFSRFLRTIKYLIFGFKCEDCFNYNIGDGIDNIRVCEGCKNNIIKRWLNGIIFNYMVSCQYFYSYN